MLDVDIYASGLGIALTLAIIVWMVSLPTRKLAFADALWPLLIMAMTLAYVHQAPQPADRAYIALFLVTVWAVRLSTFIVARNRWLSDDPQYRNILRSEVADGSNFGARSLYMGFGLQAISAWVISLPLLGAALGGAPLGWLDALAVTVWLGGFLVGAVTDQRADRAPAPDHGLRHWRRHPNLIGEACVWWGFGLLALAAGAWWGLLGPALRTLLLAQTPSTPRTATFRDELSPGCANYAHTVRALTPGPSRRPQSS